jgi:hypothetical protein
MSRDWSYTLYLGGGGLMPRETRTETWEGTASDMGLGFRVQGLGFGIVTHQSSEVIFERVDGA